MCVCGVCVRVFVHMSATFELCLCFAIRFQPSPPILCPITDPQESRDQCDVLGQRLREGVAYDLLVPPNHATMPGLSGPRPCCQTHCVINRLILSPTSLGSNSSPPIPLPNGNPQEARDQCDVLEQRLQEGAAALAEAAAAVAERASQGAHAQVRTGSCSFLLDVFFLNEWYAWRLWGQVGRMGFFCTWAGGAFRVGWWF